LVILFFFDLNIIFNLSHPSNHSQTLTNFTLNPLLTPLIYLKWTTETSNSNPLESIISLYLQSTLREKEWKEEGDSSIFKSSLLCLGLMVISRLKLCPQFIFQLNYENHVKIWRFQLFLQKQLITKIWKLF